MRFGLFEFVMTGLVPGIHVFTARRWVEPFAKPIIFAKLELMGIAFEAGRECPASFALPILHAKIVALAHSKAA
jgi:hypothetical protein